MTSYQLIGAGILIAALIPSLIAMTEKKRLHDGFHVALGLSGLLYWLVSGGFAGFMLALVSACGTLIFLSALVAFTQKRLDSRLLSGGEIKRLASGAAWLHPFGACIYLLVILIIGLAIAQVGRARPLPVTRNGFAAMSASTLFLIFIGIG